MSGRRAGDQDSAADVERVRRAYEALNESGVSALESVLAPEVRWLESPPSVMPARLTRHDVVARLDTLGWEQGRFEPHDLAASGRRIVATVRDTRVDDRGGSSTPRRGHYWELGDEGAVRLEVHRWPIDALGAAHGYFALLEDLHEWLRPRTYAEVGVYTGRSLARARPGTRIVGIDPKPLIADPAVEDAARIFRLTSDEFFRTHDLREELGGFPVDLSFIDGLHLFEFVLRDLINLERAGTGRSVIVVHDTDPPDADMAARESCTPGWTGDVWKLIPCLREQRPELRVAQVDLPPGLTIVSGLDPRSTKLTDRYDEMLERYGSMDYSLRENWRAELVPRTGDDRALLEQILPGGASAGSAGGR